MQTRNYNYKVRLGLFVVIGLALFVLAIFIIGKQRNLFDPVFPLSATFANVSGLQLGNNVRFSGIDVGTVENIVIMNDSTVRVDMLIKSDVRKFIRSDCKVAIGSEGLIGDRLLVISGGSAEAPQVKPKQQLASIEPVETDAIISSLQVTAGNAEVISAELADIMTKINTGKGTLGRLIQDSTIAGDFKQTMSNLKKGSKGLNENMEAAKDNFLLKGYFKKKEKAAEKRKKEQEEAAKEKAEAQKKDKPEEKD